MAGQGIEPAADPFAQSQ